MTMSINVDDCLFQTNIASLAFIGHANRLWMMAMKLMLKPASISHRQQQQHRSQSGEYPGIQASPQENPGLQQQPQ